jgi:hypothetical protein
MSVLSHPPPERPGTQRVVDHPPGHVAAAVESRILERSEEHAKFTEPGTYVK